jgi:mannose-1-phosphate guanylyltransferase
MPNHPIAVVIPAGGGGTRLWPRSRRSSPKQFLDIVEPGRSMLQMTVDRIAPTLTLPSSVFVISSAQHNATVRDQLPDLPTENIIGEPVGRNSAPAIGLMASIVESRLGADAIMVVLSADHAIENVPGFLGCLDAAIEAARRDYLVTIGIKPTCPETGYGYIHRGQALMDWRGHTIFEVTQFREKPDRDTAEHYLASGEFDWNAGMYITKVSTLRDLYKKHLPESEPHFAELVASVGTPDQESVFERVFPLLPKISIDFAIVEKAQQVAVVPADIGWSDVGTWVRLADILKHRADANGNIAVSKAHRWLDSQGCLVYAPDKTVVVLGVDDLIMVDTPDAILVATKDRSEDVKRIVELLQEEGRHDLL